MNRTKLIPVVATALLCSGQVLAQCIRSGEVDQYTYFVAVDPADKVTREPGLSSFTVQRSRKGAAEVAYTTPTITEIDATNLPGVYALLIDEDTTLDAGDDVQNAVLHITQASMEPVTKEICIERPKITIGETLTVSSEGDANADVKEWLATDVATPGTAGVPSVDVLRWNNVALGTTNPLPNAAAGASGGLLINGGNTGAFELDSLAITGNFTIGGTTTWTGLFSLDDGLDIAASTSNRSAFVATGNGTGHGAVFTSGSGATGNGAQFTAGSTNGNGIGTTATGSGVDVQASFLRAASISLSGGAVTVGTNNDKTGYTLSSSVNNCLPTLGCETQGTLNGTHSSTTADLGASAPGATTEVVGKMLVVTGKLSRIISGYDSGTGVVTFAPSTSLTLSNGDQWYLWGTAPSATPTQVALDALPLNCSIDTATFPGSTTTVGCDLTDIYGAVVTSATGKLSGKELCVTSGAQIRECRFISASTTWNGSTNELEITLTRAMPATLADGVTAIIR